MNNNEKAYKGCGLTILALFILSVTTNVWLIKRDSNTPEPETIVKHDTLWRDTIIHSPTPTASTQTGRTVFIPYIVERTDTLHDRDTIQVPVPIEQKRYDDSLYTAWVSGYQPQLDSIALHQPEVVTTVERTIIKPAPRWSIGPSVGAGVSITGQQQAGIYVGFTIQWRMWPK